VTATDGVSGPPRRSGRLLALGAGATVMVSALSGAASWKAADALLLPRPLPERPPLRLGAVRAGAADPLLVARLGDRPAAAVRVAARREPLAGIWGLEWPTGWGVVGDLPDGPQAPHRCLLLLAGTLPDTSAGPVPVRLRPSVWPSSPEAGPVAVAQHVVQGPLGALPCWLVEGRGRAARTHVVLVHGRRADKGQLWRHVAALAPLGVTCRVASYRNDPDAPATGRYELGAGEWADIEAVLDSAVAAGAQRLVLVGLSMGGAIVAEVLRRTAHRGRVAGVVLDAPVLDWASVLRHVARARRVGVMARPLVPAILALAARRARMDARRLTTPVDPASFEVPVLLIHGDADRIVPVATSDALADALPHLVTYLRVPGGGHVTSWNVAPDGYDTALRQFVADVVG
jgi:pimeloyl-ACP methyl ester carboxylesterase